MRVLLTSYFAVVLCSSTAYSQCWWTGCLSPSWAQKGCYPESKHYQVDSKPCHWGRMNRCCLKSKDDNIANLLENENSATETGICSYYGDGHDVPDRHPTASGEPFERFAMKAAHKSLPFGTIIRVRNLNTGKTVDVTINDRGPFFPGRIIDLTFGAFGEIAKHKKGLVKCDYTIL